ncbi:unnamed protein product [Meganyctiphanes norvegica]|uniref:C2H2-type domain-containing protein n=1 Tax=Meganyctiphanes norvegica TaxID=48144 RepID=A0AAV2R8Y1_MEGNR
MDHMDVKVDEQPIEAEYITDFNFSTSEKGNLAFPQITHTGKKPLQCSNCYKTFAFKSHLDRHQKTHNGEKPFQCSHCIKCFAQQSNLVRHQKIHIDEKSFQCSYCLKSFTEKATLVRHQKYILVRSHLSVVTVAKVLYRNLVS